MKKQNVFLSIIIFLFIALRLYLILTSQYHLDGDRSIEGIMAKHIAEKGVHPIFLYGIHYGGSLSMAAHLTATLFSLFGISALYFRISAIIISLAFLISAYIFTKKFFGNKIALISTTLMTFAPIAFIKININVPSYMIALTFNLVAIWIFFEIFYKKRGLNHSVALGLIFGIGWLSSEFIIPTILIIFFFFYLNNKTFFMTKNVITILISTIIGLIPLIYYNITNNFANIKQFFAGNIIHKIACDYSLLPKTMEFGGKMVEHCKVFGETRSGSSMSEVIIKTIPAFFSDIKILSIILSLIFLSSIVLIVYKYKFQVFQYIKSIIPNKRFDLNTNSLSKEIFLTFFILFFILAAVMAGFSNQDYLMPIYPFVMIIISIFILKLKQPFTTLILILFITSSIVSVINEAQKPDINDMSKIITFLKENQLNTIYATHFTKWSILFQSKEEIIVSCQDLCPCMYRYPEYEQTVERSDRYAYIFGEERPLNVRFQEYLDSTNTTYEKTTIIGHDIYYNFSEELRPKTAIPYCTHYEG